MKLKFFSAGETGEIFMHEGAPFTGQGVVIDKHTGSYMNAMALCDETHRLYVVTSCKKILVFDSETGDKIC